MSEEWLFAPPERVFRHLVPARDALYNHFFETPEWERTIVDPGGLNTPVGRDNIWGVGFGFKGFPPDSVRRLEEYIHSDLRFFPEMAKEDYRRSVQELFRIVKYQPCIKMYVIKKFQNNHVERAYLANNAMESIGQSDVPIDVVEIGELTPAGSANSLKLPASIINKGLPHDAEGTLGAVVRSNKGNDVILSCAHVLVDPTDLSNRDILYPAPRRASRTLKKSEIIGKWVEYRLYKRPKKNQIDAALATLQNYSSVTSRFNGARDPTTVERVKKNGIKTGLTHGIITGYLIKFKSIYYNKWSWMDFENVHRVTNWFTGIEPPHGFCDEGDSGAIAESDDEMAIGLVFVVEGKNSGLICNFTEVQSELRFSLPSKEHAEKEDQKKREDEERDNTVLEKYWGRSSGRHNFNRIVF